MKVLVTGATGFVGRHVVARLSAAGHEVRALARGAGGADLPGEVERFSGDVTDPASIESAARGADACVHLVAVIVERKGQTFARVNAAGTENVVRALRATGVRRLVHLSALGASPDERFPYLRSKWLGEEAVRASGLDWTILRPSMLFGEGAGFFRPIVWSLRWMPFYPLVARGRTRFSPLAVEDLAECVVRALAGAGVRQALDLGGPEVLSFADMVRLTKKALGKRRLVLPAPMFAARAFAATQSIRKNPLVTNGQLDMVVLDNTAPTDSVARAFGFAPRAFAGSDLSWLARL